MTLDPSHFELVIDGTTVVPLEVDARSSIARQIATTLPVDGNANQIQGELFFYTTAIDLPFDGTETETHQPGDVVYWRAAGGARRYGVLVMHGTTEYGDGSQPRSNGPAIRFARVTSDLKAIRSVEQDARIELRVRTS